MATLTSELERSDSTGASIRRRNYVERLTEACATARASALTTAWKKRSRTALGFDLFRFILKRGD